MDKDLVADIIDWDIVNWSKALDYWTKNVDLKSKGYSCLEVGSRKGGLSLWLALNGNNVICSDLESPEQYATPVHAKYDLKGKIEYQAINATEIPYENHFDIVVMKSILGGISFYGEVGHKQQAIEEMYKSLKPGGKLLFAENLESSFLHRFFRKKFVQWGGRWNYLKYSEIESLFGSFETIRYKTVGFFGTFGRSEKQRRFLGKVDNIFERLVPKSKRYIVVGIAEKALNA